MLKFFNVGSLVATTAALFAGYWLTKSGARANDIPMESSIYLSIFSASDGEFLGCLDCGNTHAWSVFNPHGTYGTPYGFHSLTNPYGRFGSLESPESACNPYATTPPVAYQFGIFQGHVSVSRIYLASNSGRNSALELAEAARRICDRN